MIFSPYILIKDLFRKTRKLVSENYFIKSLEDFCRVDWKWKNDSTTLIICWPDCFLCNKEMSKNPPKMMKIINIDEENLHIFWTTLGISMKFSGICNLVLSTDKLFNLQVQEFWLKVQDNIFNSVSFIMEAVMICIADKFSFINDNH